MASMDIASPLQRNWDRVLFHVDMDSFFASIEIRDNPALCGKPVIVGGRPDGRSVVSSPSYEARRFGVRSAMPCSQAKRLCPHAVFISGNINKYVECSKRLQKLLIDFTQQVEPFSIDESFMQFTLDWNRRESIQKTGEAVREAVRTQLGVNATIGIAPNKMLAKLCSKAAKPDGLKILPPEQVDSFLISLPVGALWGVGERTRASLHRMGIYSVKDLRKFTPDYYKSRFGSWGEGLQAMAWGVDDSPLHPWYEKYDAKSLGHEETFSEDIRDQDRIMAHLMELSEKVGMRLRKHRYLTRLVTVKRKLPDFTLQTRGHSLAWSTDLDKDLFQAARAAFLQFPDPGRAIRLIGVSAGKLIRSENEQEGLLIKPVLENEMRLTHLMDDMRKKYGESIIHRARSTVVG